MIWMADLHGRCTYVNWAWLKFRGRTVEQELGKGYLSAIHPADLKGCLSTASRAYPARKPFLVRYRALRADGQYCPVEDVASPWFDADSKTGGYMGCVKILDPRDAPGDDALRRLSLLTPREREVLALIADGNATKAVAAMLRISYKTADSHRTRLQRKLDLHDTATMVRFAVRSGLV